MLVINKFTVKTPPEAYKKSILYIIKNIPKGTYMLKQS